MKPGPRKPILPLILAVGLFALSGCGSNSQIDAKDQTDGSQVVAPGQPGSHDYRDQLVAILDDMHRANDDQKGKEDDYNNNPSQDRSAQLKRFATLVRSRSNLFEPFRPKLQGLEPPASFKRFHKALLKLLQDQFEIESKAADYLDAGDTSSEEAFVGEKRLVLVEDSKELKSAASQTGDSKLDQYGDILWPGQN